jgi:hypothetical protein
VDKRCQSASVAGRLGKEMGSRTDEERVSAPFLFILLNRCLFTPLASGCFLFSLHPTMLINYLPDGDGSRCTLTYEEADGWLRATWRGYVDAAEALRGAENYLAHAGPFQCAYLLNDNTDLQGSWFDSVEWLEQVWLPQALQRGLQYVAHVVQADTRTDILTLTFPAPLVGVLELQLFHQVAEAEEWLRSCQQLTSL